VPVPHTASHKIIIIIIIIIIIKKGVLNKGKNAYLSQCHLPWNFYTKPVDSPLRLQLVHIAYCYAFDGNSLIK
jgi:hypothetical protein